MQEEFFAEAGDLATQMSNDLLAIDAGLKKGRYDPETLNSFFRAAHSLKGIAGVYGLAEITGLSHAMETFLDLMRLGKIQFTPEIIDLLFETLEVLGQCIDQPGVRPENYDAVLGRILARSTPSLSDGEAPFDWPPGIEKSLLEVFTEYETHRLRENLRRGALVGKVHASFPLMTFDQDLEALNQKLKQRGEIIATLPSSEMSEPDHINFDLLTAVELEAAAFPGFVEQEGFRWTELVSPGKPSPSSPPPPAAARESRTSPGARAERGSELTDPPEKSPAEGMGDRGGPSIRVATAKLDTLLNQVGELLLVKSQFGEMVQKLREDHGFTGLAIEFYKLHRLMERKLRDLQASSMEMRMTPIGQLYDKVARITRKTAREAGKEIDLQVEGRDVELDKMIIEDLSDPLLHLIRNSIDHGIEAPQERVMAGKAEVGRLRLSAAQRGNYVTLTLQDDGRGLDMERIREKAVQRGLITASAELSRRETIDLIFQPGFSTRDTATELSGRGVGMDVVKRNIGALGGFIQVDSETGRGMTVTLSLPITLAIIQALVIGVTGAIFAVPLNAILETLLVHSKDIRYVDRREVIEYREKTLRLLRLWELIGLPDPEPRSSYYVVVVGLLDRTVGLMVEEVHSQQDIVIKSMGRLRDVPGVAGATELGNQQTALVLDVGALIEQACA